MVLASPLAFAAFFARKKPLGPSHSVRQPEGRGRQDDLGGQRRGLSRLGGVADAPDRRRSAGERDDRPRGHQAPAHGDVPAHAGGHCSERGVGLARSRRVRPRSGRPLVAPRGRNPDARPRAPATLRSGGGHAGRAVRSRGARLPPVARSADAAGARLRGRGHRAPPVRVLRDGGAQPGRRGNRPGLRAEKPAPSARRDRADDVRRVRAALARRRGGRSGALRRPGLPGGDSSGRAPRRSGVPRAEYSALRRARAGCSRVRRVDQRGDPP